MKVFAVLTLFLCFSLKSQDVVDQIDTDSLGFSSSAPETSTETIEKISASGRIFILSNNNNSYGKGDFISLVLDDKLVNRALVAKTENSSGGIKLLKIYNSDLHKLLRPGTQVQVIRGDDSYFGARSSATGELGLEDKALIKNEEELFDETTLLEEDNISLDENSKREIKTDNIVSLFLAQVEGQDTESSTTRYTQISGAYAYQVSDNIWGEVSYGQGTINSFPANDLSTTYTSLIFKIKYTISAPFYSYVQPYVGYQILNASSDLAGQGQNDDSNAEELELLENLKKRQVIFGVSLLKRLVPGWFARLDIGTDLLGGGFALEF